MLVLTRRQGESVMVGDEVVITVLEVRGEVIRLGIQAPRSVQVHREEVYKELQRANREAALATDVTSEDVARAVANLLGNSPTAAGIGGGLAAGRGDTRKAEDSSESE
jgi:carbon storage regulator